MKNRVFNVGGIRLMKVVALAMLVCMPGCNGDGDTETNNGENREAYVYATNEPARYITTMLLGDSIQVDGPEFGGKDPAEWIPSDDEVRTIQAAKLIIDSGAKSSPWMIKVTLPESKIVDLTGPVFDDLITVEDLTVHKHGPEGEHSHGGVVSTVWMDPSLLSKQATKLAERLSIEFPDQKDKIVERAKELQSTLRELASALRLVHSSAEAIEVVSYAPVFKYLASAANLDDKHFHWDLDGELDSAKLEKFNSYLETAKPKFALVAREPSDELVEQLEAKGLKCVVIDPCEQIQPGNDYAKRFEKNVERLKQALSTGE